MGMRPRDLDVSDADLTPVATPRQEDSPKTMTSTPPGTPCSGAVLTKSKSGRAPNAKTVRIVRKLTEIHNLLGLQLPVAPKQFGVESSKSSRKNERRRGGSKASGEDKSGDDGCGWAIASGNSDFEPLPSPLLR